MHKCPYTCGCFCAIGHVWRSGDKTGRFGSKSFPALSVRVSAAIKHCDQKQLGQFIIEESRVKNPRQELKQDREKIVACGLPPPGLLSLLS